MFRRAIAGFVVVMALFVTGCSNSVALQEYSDMSGLFSFYYPNGMEQVQAPRSSEGRSLLFLDLINSDELVSFTVADYDKADSIEELGDLEAVGTRVANNLLAPEGSGRTATLMNGGVVERDGENYYILEYALDANGLPRHDVVAVTIQRHKLFTLTASTSESRWDNVKGAFYEVAKSLTVN